MEQKIGNNGFKKFSIKNRGCYYFDDIIKLEYFDLDDNLIYKKWYFFRYDIPINNFIDPQLLRIRFNKIDGSIRIYGGTRYLTLFRSEKTEAIYNRIRSLISLKSGITNIFFNILIFIILLPFKKLLTLYNAILHIKSVLNKDENHC